MKYQQNCNRWLLLSFLLLLHCRPLWGQGRVEYADWRLEWAEEFNTPMDSTGLAERWQFYYPWGRALLSPIETGFYTGQELQARNGLLQMTMHKLEQPVVYRGKALRYTTGMLFSKHDNKNDSLRPYNCGAGEGFSYGLFEVRARQSQSPNSAPAFWLFGGVPDEIDIFEGAPNSFGNNFHLAPGGYWRPSRQETLTCQCPYYNTDPTGTLAEQFHTYGMSWLPNEVVFYFDGVPIRHETRLVPAGCAMSIIVNIAALSWANHPSDTLSIDYIRVYRPRQLPALPPALRQGAYYPETEQAWLPAETQPGRLNQDTHQGWRLAPAARKPQQLELMLTDNYNPACDIPLPLPIAGHWAPAWAQTYGVPELQVQLATPDTVAWAVHDSFGQVAARGQATGKSWRPQFADLPPGAYSLHLQQGRTATTQPLFIIGRPAHSGPTEAWQLPASPTPTAE